MSLFRGPQFKGEVERVQTEGGSHIEPAFDGRWSDADKMRWKAAVVTVDTGIRVDVTVNTDGLFGFRVGRSSVGVYDFQGGWDFLVGVSLGAQEVPR